ncbi:MAG: hypothetical protein ACI8TV_001655 [Porticoccaceae bacterium]|jgi:hypothetical protein
MLAKLSWLINRLRCMSLPEISHRVTVLIHNALEKRGLLRAKPGEPCVSTASKVWAQADVSKPDELAVAAQKLLNGTLDVFALKDYALGEIPDWNKDPKTGRQAPLDFGKTLNYRDENIVGDIKYLWEPSRHLQLVTLARRYAFSGDINCLQSLRAQLDSWFLQCPYMLGAQWTSSLELGIRLLNWSIVWQLVGGENSKLFIGDDGLSFRSRWLSSIYEHVHFIQTHYSRFTSANNHLIGEASGVYVAVVTWPYWPEFSQWGVKAKSILEEEAQRQNHSDGVNKEQAVSYQQFVLDFLLLPYLAARANGQEFSAAYLNCVEAMMSYLASLIDVAGNIPMIGDADDGYAIKGAYGDGFCPYRSLLATGAVLFDRTDFKLKSKEFDDKSMLLLGEAGRLIYDRLDNVGQVLPLQTSFNEGGYYLIGNMLDSAKEVRLLIDAGPLGYGGIAAHGHADALSVYLSVAGREILVDPGTYAYHTEKKWRDYFRGTSAHNTIRIDGQDQSQIGGNFMWLAKAESKLEELENTVDTICLLASHNGYLRLPNPVSHQREVILDKNTGVYELCDRINFSSQHEIEQLWHFAEACDVQLLEGNVIRVSHGPVTVTMELDPKLHLLKYVGDTDRPLGWVSRSFDNKVASSTVCGSIIASSNTMLTTRITIDIQ